MITTDIAASVYVLLDNASEEELDYAVFLELFGSVINVMRQEQILGNLDDIIIKDELVFSDSTGLKSNTLTNFGDAVYLEFNGDPIEECPVNMLDQYSSQGLQRVAFWTDAEDNLSRQGYVQLAIPQMGTLKIWYEPEVTELNATDATTNFPESLRWCIATRIAVEAINYTKFKSPLKLANRGMLKESLKDMAKKWKDIYLTKINKIGTGRPFSRTPFMAGVIDG